jgi:drug/metabolite transporter (DMT)-like permease
VTKWHYVNGYAGTVPDLKLALPAIVAMAMWATNFVFSPAIIADVGAIQLAGARWLIALVALIPLALWREKSDWSTIRREIPLHLVQSVLGYVGYTLLVYSALQSTSPVTAAVIIAVNPATIAIAAQFVLKSRLSRLAVIGIVLSFVGALVVVLGGQSLGDMHVTTSDVLVLGATVLWTIYSMIAPRLQTPPITATAVQATLAALIMIPLMLVDEIVLNPGSWTAVQGMEWWGVLWIGLIPSAGAYFLWNVSSELIGPTRTGAFLNLIPVFTAVLVVFLGGSVTVWHLIGGTLVLLGVALTERRTAVVPERLT